MIGSFSFKKFFGGFNLLNGSVFGKVTFYFIIAAIAIGIYHKLFVSPTTRTIIGSGGTQENKYFFDDTPKQDLFTFGCANLKIDTYWKKKREIVK